MRCLAPLVRRLDEAVAHPNPKIRCERIKRALHEAVESGGVGDLLGLPEDSDSYSRHLLHLDPRRRYSVVGMVWKPGQRTPLHDHAGVWCVECVVRGRMRVTSFDVVDEDADGLYLFEEKSRVIAATSESGALIPPFEYHRMENPFDETSITIHVYEGEMTWCHVFDERSHGRFCRRRESLGYSTT